MSEADETYGLLSETSSIDETRNPARQRHLPARAALDWLQAGWRDLLVQPGLSLSYGIVVFIITALLAWALFAAGRDYILFPAIAGYMIIAPVLAIGLYEKSRTLEAGEHPTLRTMLLVRPQAGAQIFYTGLMLCLLMLLWNRAAVLIYALFFGVRAFPGLDGVVAMLLTTPAGWGMLIVGTLIGGLFAAFGFAISVFSIPMLLDQRTDALTAMGTSMAMVWNNLTPTIAWGAIVLALFAASAVTGFLGFIVIFPLLGHATWHAYRAMR
ncbi:DUF2189 domain-containing protein [Microvirga guangxiensis]|uniref:Uncharacterized membrane protein n=1 Tax=Microvirga guangxiensis TaxID=549386 RepID=A0A1G5LM02_9HYPH|nr:DUF2189 domain-containing protein [Microvirga guangxiensis]SCZ13654.1 Uncharacterized membrane protein [Microvirga guangxiensis]